MLILYIIKERKKFDSIQSKVMSQIPDENLLSEFAYNTVNSYHYVSTSDSFDMGSGEGSFIDGDDGACYSSNTRFYSDMSHVI